MPEANRQRVLIISKSPELRSELVTLLSGYGYFVEFCSNRKDGIRKFRSHKQPIVILDVPTLRAYSNRLFRFFQMVRRNTIVLIAATKGEEPEAFERLALGAFDILNLPLKTDFLKLTLSRAFLHHKLILENIFVKNFIFFSLLMLPIWAYLGYLIIKE
jgi:DNA-binding NtrC family response regulator